MLLKLWTAYRFRTTLDFNDIRVLLICITGHICLHVGQLRATDIQQDVLVSKLGAGSRHVHGIRLNGMRSALHRRQILVRIWNTETRKKTLFSKYNVGGLQLMLLASGSEWGEEIEYPFALFTDTTVHRVSEKASQSGLRNWRFCCTIVRENVADGDAQIGR